MYIITVLRYTNKASLTFPSGGSSKSFKQFSLLRVSKLLLSSRAVSSRTYFVKKHNFREHTRIVGMLWCTGVVQSSWTH